MEGLNEILKQVAWETEITYEKTQSEEEVQVQLKKEMQHLRDSLVIWCENRTSTSSRSTNSNSWAGWRRAVSRRRTRSCSC